MSDQALHEFISQQLPCVPGKATIFAHKYFLELESSDHEVCPHPLIQNLNDWDSDLNRLESSYKVRPTGIRPHSCVYSHLIGIDLHKKGYKYISQSCQLFQAGLTIYPHPWGIWEVPIYYMDNMSLCMSENWSTKDFDPFSQEYIDAAINSPGLYVFDFTRFT